MSSLFGCNLIIISLFALPQSAGVELLSIGPARSKSGIAALPTILKVSQ
jgi:hypothetical protein